MMIQLLDEYCLRYLFDFFRPDDWARMSQVCQFWEEILKSKWKNITKISRLPTSGYNENTPTISVEEVKEIMTFVAPYITVLDLSQHTFENCITFGNYLYRVENLGDDDILDILDSKKVRDICETRFYKLPSLDKSRTLFQSNSITKVEFCDSPDIYPNIPTNGIKEMNVEFTSDDNIRKFINLFPDLERLELTLRCLRYINRYLKDKPKKILKKIVPYLTGLKAFHLKFYPECKKPHLELRLFLYYNLKEYSQLEEMSIISSDLLLRYLPHLVQTLSKCCPKLPSVLFRGVKVEDDIIDRMVKTTPNLQINCDLAHQSLEGWTIIEWANTSYFDELRINFTNHDKFVE